GRLAGLRVCPTCRSKHAAFDRIHIESIDDQDVVERGAQTRKEPGPRRHKFSLREPGTSIEEATIGPAIVVRHCAVRKDDVHWRLLAARYLEEYARSRRSHEFASISVRYDPSRGEVPAAALVRYLAPARACHADFSAGLRGIRAVRRPAGHEERDGPRHRQD